MNEEKLDQFYRSYIDEELKSPEVQEAKKKFLDKHFSAQPQRIFSGVGVPALAFATLFLLAGILSPQYFKKPAPLPSATLPGVQSTLQSQSISQKTYPAIPEMAHVESISSQVGPTMIYHKTYPDVNVTVVWVLPAGA